MSSLEEYLYLAIQASLRAGEAILEAYQQPPQFKLKANLSPLTQADQDAHRIIQENLLDAPKKLPILSEEGRNVPYVERKHWKDFWLVDPLDGTKEFLKQNGEFTVNIALIREGKPILGVVYAPALKVLYFSAEGLGAFKSEELKVKSGEFEAFLKKAQKLNMSPVPKQGEVLRVAASRSHTDPETNTFLERLGNKYKIELTNAGSSLKFCFVAEGKMDLYPRFAPTMEWDTAAGQAIVEQAGGIAAKWKSGTLLVYNKENLLNPHFVAASLPFVDLLFGQAGT